MKQHQTSPLIEPAPALTHCSFPQMEIEPEAPTDEEVMHVHDLVDGSHTSLPQALPVCLYHTPFDRHPLQTTKPKPQPTQSSGSDVAAILGFEYLLGVLQAFGVIVAYYEVGQRQNYLMGARSILILSGRGPEPHVPGDVDHLPSDGGLPCPDKPQPRSVLRYQSTVSTHAQSGSAAALLLLESLRLCFVPKTNAEPTIVNR